MQASSIHGCLCSSSLNESKSNKDNYDTKNIDVSNFIKEYCLVAEYITNQLWKALHILNYGNTFKKKYSGVLVNTTKLYIKGIDIIKKMLVFLLEIIVKYSYKRNITFSIYYSFSFFLFFSVFYSSLSFYIPVINSEGIDDKIIFYIIKCIFNYVIKDNSDIKE
ncbi:hypothetical protein BCR36DRAFT_366163 [Piromyces finnis]|uniref:Uncharacterized protein n=1 Tax=Piromyces finnis TaxID=1754191 RepID=A0A1Y1VML2_9FUNG|nr:hypothetical protein BCR36DRAFT_366163 [Piromyces finnis]|eukprot:ORX60157.1 hypothetical protein BCR36DRAFT_366163 [Piromyces finnis]